MIDIDSLTVGQLKEIAALTGGASPRPKAATTPLPFKIGDGVLIRTVTHYALGKVGAIGRDFITLSEGGWLADTGRLGECLSKGTVNEFERAPSWIMIGRGAICDVFPWAHEIPKSTK
jgi:hypothetical protein